MSRDRCDVFLDAAQTAWRHMFASVQSATEAKVKLILVKNLPSLLLPQQCVKPRKVEGVGLALPSPVAARTREAPELELSPRGMDFAARHPVRVYPYQRFAHTLTDVHA